MTNLAVDSGREPPRAHAFTPSLDQALDWARQAANPGSAGASVAERAQAAVASAAHDQLAGRSSAADTQAGLGSASPRAQPSSSGDLGGGRPVLEPWQRARALNEERDLARRLRQHVAEVSGQAHVCMQKAC